MNRVMEWITDAEGVHLLSSPPHIAIGWWFIGDNVPPGLGIRIFDKATGLSYDAWLPEAEALRVRDVILSRWPVTPEGGNHD